MADYEPNQVLASQTFRVVGTRPIRPDGTDKVTGAALYGGDYRSARLLHGKILRSPYAHARIRSIDTSQAEAHPGVRAVVAATDLPIVADRSIETGELRVNLRYLSENILAREKVVYKGQAIVAVAADNPHVAEEALELIKVEYEVLPPVLTVQEAMKEDAPLIHEHLRTRTLGGQTAERPSNVALHMQQKLGDIEQGFAQADVIVEREFSTKMVHQGYIEPQNATAYWNKDGKVTIWCSTQGSFSVRETTALLLRIPESQIKVVPLEIGGGFGGKLGAYLEPLAVLLSRKSGYPVKLIMSRKEVFEGTGPTSGTVIKVKMGATKEGKITAAQASLVYEAGAFPGSAVGAGANCIFGGYDLPNVEIEGFDVVVNKPRTAAYRAPGAPAAAFAGEQVVDELAEKLGLDPLEFRLMNAAKEGTRRPSGQVAGRIGCVELLEAMQNHSHWKAPLGGPHRGRGVAIGFWGNAGMHSSCTITVNQDGTVSLVEGNVDLGGTRASIAMQAAEVLGIPAEDVHPTVADTDSTGYTGVSGGSRTTFSTGWAAYEAAQDVARQMIERAARIWNVDPSTVELEQGVFRSMADPQLQMTFKQVAGQLNRTGGTVIGGAAVNPRGVGPAYAGSIVDVEVDPETGKVAILRFTAVQDAGKAIHPSYVEGQMQGGSVQGIGWALHEEYFYNDAGEMLNGSFLDYRMPTSLDLPMIDTVIVEVANPGHPFGARGVGEVPIVPPLAAIANAIHKAIGVRMTRLPMNPNAIMEALWQKEKELK